jgi:hypothetical protein
VGADVGDTDGLVGALVGAADGATVGASEGTPVGSNVGRDVGYEVGVRDVGMLVGADDGRLKTSYSSCSMAVALE